MKKHYVILHIFNLFSFSVPKMDEKEPKTRPVHGRCVVQTTLAIYVHY